MALVRPARLGDVRRIAEVHVRSWQAAYRGLIPDDFLDALSVDARVEWRAARLAGLPDRWAMLVVEEAGTVVGFADTAPCRDEDRDPRTTGELLAMYLHPDYWQRGLGRLLMEGVVDRLRADGFETATLWVLRENSRARRFYEAAGWRADGAQRTEPVGPVMADETRYVLEL